MLVSVRKYSSGSFSWVVISPPSKSSGEVFSSMPLDRYLSQIEEDELDKIDPVDQTVSALYA